jgi:hypothetical protein
MMLEPRRPTTLWAFASCYRDSKIHLTTAQTRNTMQMGALVQRVCVGTAGIDTADRQNWTRQIRQCTHPATELQTRRDDKCYQSGYLHEEWNSAPPLLQIFSSLLTIYRLSPGAAFSDQETRSSSPSVALLDNWRCTCSGEQSN